MHLGLPDDILAEYALIFLMYVKMKKHIFIQANYRAQSHGHTSISEDFCGITQNTNFQYKFSLLLHLSVENK